MSQTADFYEARANECAAEAAGAALENVRERALRSEKTWRELAVGARRLVKEREKAEAIRIARREAEAQVLC